MAGHEFSPKLAPAAERHEFMTGSQAEFFLGDGLKPRTVILIGALVQIVLYGLLPARWAVVPATALLLNSVLKTALQALSPRSNDFMANVVPGRTTAQIPSATGKFGPDPGEGSIVVFNLGVQWNHPLGVLAPGVRDISRSFFLMAQDLDRRRDELGLLGSSRWRAKERGSNSTFINTFFFRDVESVHRFAHEDLHRRAWDRYAAAKPPHVGIFHETFVVPARAFESMYVNCHPVSMGRAVFHCEGAKGDDERYVNSLVSADTPELKTQWSRMGRDEGGSKKARFLKDGR